MNPVLSSPLAAGQDKSVLIVEDDAGVLRIQQKRLERAGFRVTTATTADEALRAVQEDHFDLLILDYRLPGPQTGLDVHESLKSRGVEIPVILVTGFSDEATVVKALRAGVQDFVTKSVEYLNYLPEAATRVLAQASVESRLAESEARLSGIIQAAADAIIVTESDRRITLFNPAAERTFDCPAERAIGKSISCFVPPTIVDEEQNSSDGTPSLTHLIRFGNRGRRCDGSEFPIEASLSRADVHGRRLYIIIVRDVTERLRAEEEERFAREKLAEQAALLDQATDAIVVSDLDGRVSYWNRGAERLYGWSASEMFDEILDNLVDPTFAAVLERAHKSVRTEGEWAGELLNRSKDEREITVESRWTLLCNEQGEPKSILIISTDVTERRQLESQYRHAQRMEGIGRLAGGIAHDFNNLLTVILGFSDVLFDQMGPADPSRELVMEIRRAGERAASLTRQMLAFSRKQILAPQVFNLNDLVSDVERMLRRLIGEDIDLATSLDPTLGKVKADTGEIEQVLLNLVVNARDAMPEGGRLTLETRNVRLEDSYAQEHAETEPGMYVMLAVSDTGIGMDEATKAQIFEPFFTTKEVGKGTGLGLATVYGIVKQSGGRVEVYSELGMGTTFKIYLPQVNEVVDAAVLFDAARARGGNETVLLAEDEDAVRMLARLTLEAQGYRVVEARNGEEAMELWRRGLGKVDLLVTDVVMPKVGGRQLADFLKMMAPDIRVLYVSGYADNAIVRHGVLEAGVEFLQKPFTPAALTRKVRDVLDGAKHATTRS